MHYKNHVLHYGNRVACDENHVARDASCERVVIYFWEVLPFESKDNLYYTTDVYYTMMWMLHALLLAVPMIY